MSTPQLHRQLLDQQREKLDKQVQFSKVTMFSF
jgi:hypothetical protein